MTTKANPTAPFRPDLFADPQALVVDEPVQLAAGTCQGCGRTDVPRREHCAACGAAVDPIALSFAAVLAGFTAVLHQPPGSLVEAPYALGVARFAEGICVLGQLLVDDLDTVAVGDPIQVVGVEVDDRITYGFRPTV